MYQNIYNYIRRKLKERRKRNIKKVVPIVRKDKPSSQLKPPQQEEEPTPSSVATNEFP